MEIVDLTMDEPLTAKVEPSELTLNRLTPFDADLTGPTRAEIRKSTVAQSKSPKHRWSLAERVTLNTLVQEYENEWSDVVSVFNTYHRETLPSYRGLRERVLRSQAAWMKCTQPKSPHKFSVQDLLAAPSSSFTSVEDIRTSLEAAALTEGVRLVRKTPTATNTNYANKTPRPAHQKRHYSPIQSSDSDIDNEDDDAAFSSADIHGETDRIQSLIPKTVPSNTGLSTPPDSNPRRKAYSRTTSPPTPTGATQKRSTIYSLALPLSFASRKQEAPPLIPATPTSKRGRSSHPRHPERSLSRAVNSTPQEIPLLGFRGFSKYSHGTNSQEVFRAGLFIDADIPPCPPIQSSEYKGAAILHVERDKSSPSPLISVTKNPIRAIMRACSLKRKSESYIAVIDLHKINQLGTLQQAGSLNLRPRIKYDASGEFLIWGEIQKEAIISVIPVQKLIDTPPTQPGDNDPLEIEQISKSWKAYWARSTIQSNQQSLSFFARSAVGQLVRAFELPPQYLEAAVGCVLKDWAFERQKNLKWQENKIFCEGVNHGYTGIENEASSASPEADAASSYDDTMDDAFLKQLMEAAFRTSQDSFEEEGIEDPVELVRDIRDANSGMIGVEAQDVEMSGVSNVEAPQANATTQDLEESERHGTEHYMGDVQMVEKPQDDWAWTGM